MKDQALVDSYRADVVSTVRAGMARWIRRGRHLRGHSRVKLQLAMQRLLGRPDYLSEFIFWESILGARPQWIWDRRKWREAFPQVLTAHLKPLARRDVRATVLEIGSGPVSILAAGVDEGWMTVMAVDPLAPLYSMLMRDYQLDYPIVPVKGVGEQLGERFAGLAFDAVYSSNAIDHTEDPRRCLTEIRRVLKPGGLIVLEGIEREGSNAGWTGLHQHDLFPERGHLVRTDLHGRREVLSEGLRLTCIHERVVPFEQRGIHGFGYEFPPATSAGEHVLPSWYTIAWNVR